MTNKERYATIGTWAEYFKQEEGVSMGPGRIREKLRNALVSGLTARASDGRILRNAFFSESDVRRVCSAALETLPTTDEEGFLVLEGERYATASKWAEVFGFHQSYLVRCVKAAKPPTIRARDKRGRIFRFVSEGHAREMCADKLMEVPKVGEDGYATIEGQKYGSIYTLSKDLGVTSPSIKAKVNSLALKSIEIRSHRGRLMMAYPEEALRFAFKHRLADIPIADQDGFVVINDHRYAVVETWSKIFGISKTMLRIVIERADLIPIRAKNARRSHLGNYYSEDGLRSALGELLEDCPVADEDGFTMVDGVEYASANAWAKRMGVTGNTVLMKLKASGTQSIRAKDKMGRVLDFYSFNAIKQSCGHLLDEVPRVNDENFIELDGKIYRTIRGHFRALGILLKPLEERIRESSPPFIKGRAGNGRVYKFYDEADIRELCADLIAKKSKK